MINWYLVYTKQKNEDLVEKKISGAGFEVVNAKIKERKYYRRKLQDMVSPCFPNYVFVRFDNPKDYRLIKYTRGVSSIVGTGDAPMAVPDEIVRGVAERMKDGIIRFERHDLNNGDMVRINNGPLSGIDAIFEKEMRGSDRVCVLLSAINARVVLERSMLSRCK